MAIANPNNRLALAVRQFKTFIITEELIKHNWCVSKTARAFNMHRNSLTRDMAELGISRNGKRDEVQSSVVVEGASGVCADEERSIPADTGTKNGINENASGERAEATKKIQ